MRDTSSTSPATRTNYLSRITVSRVFWEAVQDNFPGLAKHTGYPALFWYLMFGAWHDKETHRLLLPAKLIAQMEGRDCQNTEAERFLLPFQRDVLPTGTVIRWSQWRKGKCRQLLAFHLGSFENVLAKEYRRHWHDGGRVYLDGTPYSAGKQRAIRQEQKQVAAKKPGLCDDARAIQEYLNALPQNLFSRAMERNLDSALAVARQCDNPIVAREQLRLLRHIESQPVPFYGASKDGDTVRLFSSGAIPNLQSTVRRALTCDWQEADLRCAQLAICARLWQVPELQSFLASGADFWSHVLAEMNVPLSEWPTAKRAVKTSLYSICFGMEKHHLPGSIALRFARANLDKELSARFLAVQLVQTLIRARGEALAGIDANGGASTPYGKWCPVTPTRAARGVMAEIAQAWEMKLIAPLFKLAGETKEFTIALYQFDGVTVHFTRRERRWKERLTAIVREQAEREGIQTRLEWNEGTGTESTGLPIMPESARIYTDSVLGDFQKVAKMGGRE